GHHAGELPGRADADRDAAEDLVADRVGQGAVARGARGRGDARCGVAVLDLAARAAVPGGGGAGAAEPGDLRADGAGGHHGGRPHGAGRDRVRHRDGHGARGRGRTGRDGLCGAVAVAGAADGGHAAAAVDPRVHVSFGTKWAWDDGQLPDMPWWVWVAMLVAVVASVGLGELVQKRLRESGIQRLVVVLGFVGASLSLWTGLRLLLG